MARTKCPVCSKRACFAFDKRDKQWYCKQHASAGMIDINSKRCLHDDCDKQPAFNLPSEKVALYCKQHASAEMINVNSKRCLHDDCDKIPAFNLPSEKVALYCKQHASAEMIDIKSKRCLHDDCDKQPAFNLPSEKVALYCKQHASAEMIDIKNKRCLHDDCYARPNFNLPNEKVALYCKQHASAEMINVNSKRCLHDDCDKQPAFNLPSEKVVLYCKQHASAEMIDIKNKRCLHDDCDKQPNFNLPSEKVALYCKQHASAEMVNIANKRCETCNMTSMNWKYKPNCAQCHFYLNPNDPRIRNYKTKEQAFMSQIECEYPDIILDQRVSGGCSKRRPDGLIDCLTHSVIIEIDEDQHSGYESICENKRMMELFQDLGSRPIVFVRMNPDSYKINNKRVSGAFSTTKSGELKRNEKEFNRRSNELLRTVDKAINSHPTKTVSSYKLFYSDD